MNSEPTRERDGKQAGSKAGTRREGRREAGGRASTQEKHPSLATREADGNEAGRASTQEKHPSFATRERDGNEAGSKVVALDTAVIGKISPVRLVSVARKWRGDEEPINPCIDAWERKGSCQDNTT